VLDFVHWRTESRKERTHSDNPGPFSKLPVRLQKSVCILFASLNFIVHHRSLATHSGASFPIDSTLMTMQEIQYTYRFLPEHAAMKLAGISIQDVHNVDIRLALDRIKKELETCKRSFGYTGVQTNFCTCSADSSLSTTFDKMRYRPSQGNTCASNAIVPTGSMLPSGHLSHFPLRSHLGGNLISGNVFYLEDGNTCISLSEALMWADCNPFSPLNTGKRINPY
jgi:hypothetical protein